MGKKQKKSKHKLLEKIILAQAILNLIESLIELLKDLLNQLHGERKLPNSLPITYYNFKIMSRRYLYGYVF